ncbi:cytochrome P450 [Streptomyces sp. NBC_00091]|uniref:cytochrome P450 n=1 Tax=Streptomyces sp. NBC_00091 TaxID=2975648 RepID=UPI002256C99B|nr:cytochrome P450 [Streptomyces sp. NBC_00091]MCX5380528.1 cytochrome P450 [Streptomyces sp. NBC_00091]
MTTHAEPILEFPFTWDGTQLPTQVDELPPVVKVRTIAGAEAWLVSSYELVKQVLEDDRFSLKNTSDPGVPRQYALTIPPEVVNNMGNITGAGLRKAVMKAINPKSPGLQEWMDQHAADLVERMLRHGAPVDVRAMFTDPFSEAMHCHILGIPQEAGPRLAESLPIAFMNSANEIPAARLNWDRDIAYMKDRLDDTGHGLVGDLAKLRGTEGYEHITDEMFATVGVTLFGAGVISTAGFLAMALVTLLTHPAEADHLADHPELMPQAVDELLRINLSIGDGLPRLVMEDMTLGEVEVKAGELVLVLPEGANFDPAVFPDPHRLDFTRANSSAHFSFGGGSHYCPATALGKKHAETALLALLKAMPRLRLAVPVEQLVWRTGFMKRLPERLPVMW